MGRIQFVSTDAEEKKIEQFGKENGCEHPRGGINKIAVLRRLIADAVLKKAPENYRPEDVF